MQTFITIFFFITTIILFCIIIFKKQKINEINKEIEEENKKLEKDKEDIIKEINFLINKKEEKNNDLQQIEAMTINMNAAAREAFRQYTEVLNADYKSQEELYDKAMAEMIDSYDNIQDNLIEETKQIQKELDKISATRAAAMKAILQEQEVKNRLSFYCPQVPENDLKDVRILRDIEYKLSNPRVLHMLI